MHSSYPANPTGKNKLAHVMWSSCMQKIQIDGFHVMTSSQHAL